MSEATNRAGVSNLAVGGALTVATGTADLGSVTVEQAWQGLLLWARGDPRFVPTFVETEIVSDDGREVRKIVRNRIGAQRNVGERGQLSTVNDGMLITHQYLDGPWFLAITGVDFSDSEKPALFVTTLRHKLHPEFQDPDATAVAKGMAPPPTPQQNVDRIIEVIRQAVAAGEI